MSNHKPPFKTIFPILLSILFVLGYSLFTGAADPAKMQFTADTILNMEGTVSGDLIAVSGSECDAVDILGKNLTVTSIPVASSFTLKTTKHTNALKLSPSGEKVNLSFSSDNLIAGEIAQWTISSSSVSSSVNIVWGVPNAGTHYIVKANGIGFDSFTSNSNSEISFSYNKSLTTPQTFTLELYVGGPAFIVPPKPDVSDVNITSAENGSVTLSNVPANIYQIAISRTPDFKDVSWQPFDADKFKTIGQTTETLYVKFRTQSGGVSDVIVYKASSTAQSINDGDIVKTSNNFDVYIIKLKNNKQFKRLILSPSVFNSYGHLKWSNLKIISQMEMDSYMTSSLVKETTDTIIYQLFPNGDAGERKVLDVSSFYDADSVYEINGVDRDLYKLVK